MTVELKARIENLSRVEGAIKKVGATFVSGVDVVDIYFNTKEGKTLKIGIYPAGTLPKAGTFLFLYESDPVTKKFDFRQTEINDLGVLRYILDRVLGTKIVIEKTRRFNKLDDMIVEIDTIKGLGNYLILQGDDRERLLSVLEKLGVDKASLETRAFDTLLLEAKKKG